MGEGGKCELHELVVVNFKDEIADMKERMKDLEHKYYQMERDNARVEVTMNNFEQKFDSIEGTLKEIATEIKHIGGKLVAYSFEQSTKVKESTEGKIASILATGNNKVLLLVIVTLCAGLLFLLGMKVDDIAKLVKP